MRGWALVGIEGFQEHTVFRRQDQRGETDGTPVLSVTPHKEQGSHLTKS